MNKKLIEMYLSYCRLQKRLSDKTLNAYRIDLTQFINSLNDSDITEVSVTNIEFYIEYLNQKYMPKTAKRKLASLKAFLRYLEYKNLIESNPFNKIRLKFREPLLLPKTIPLHTVKKLLNVMYTEHSSAKTPYKRKRTLLDIAVIETLFATGMRISELCSLKETDVDLQEASIRIYGKGLKERFIQIGNQEVIHLLVQYKNIYIAEITSCGFFFTKPNSTPITDQIVRRMINKYCATAAINMHITPHMFRHTFATCLLESDVDIRYIQEMLGHSSITVTEIYTHVAMSKQKDILSTKHPRNYFTF